MLATLEKVSANDVKLSADTEKEHAYCLLSAQRRVREEYFHLMNIHQSNGHIWINYNKSLSSRS